MIAEDFTIKGINRFKEFQEFMKTNLPEASLRHPPVHHPNTDCYDVSIRYNLSNATVLDKLHSKWKLEDGKKVKKNSNKSFQKFFSLSIFSSF